MISKIFEENQVKRLFENMSFTTPEIAEDDYIVYSGDWTQDTTDTDDLPNICTPRDENNVLQSVKNKGEDDNHIDIIKEEDAWYKDLEYGLGHCGNEKDELPTQKVDSVISEGEVDDQLDIVKEEDEWCKDLEIDCLRHLKNENDKTPIDKVDEFAGDSGSQYTVTDDTEISQDHEVGSKLTNPVKQSNNRKIKKVQSNQNNLNGHQFNRKNNLNECAKKQTEDGTLTCKFCNKQYMYKSSLQKHMLTHPSKKKYACTLCSKQFTDKSNYNRHILLHSNDKPFKCDLCDSTFIRKPFLDTHMWTHCIEKPYKCTLCDKGFIWKTNYTRHMLKHSDKKLKSEAKGNFKCIFCKKQFKYKSSLKQHMLIHQSEKQHKPELCDKQFHRKSREIKQTGKETFRCKICNNQFKYKDGLRQHMLIHKNEKQYKCEQCGKQFHWKSRLRAHMTLHTSERPIACTLCDKQFKDKFVYKRHMSIHSGKKPFKCELCDYNSRLKTHLNRHMWTHSSVKPYNCTFCDREFICKTKYARHMLRHPAREQSTVSCDTDIPQDNNNCSLSSNSNNRSNKFEIIYNNVKYTI